MLDRMMKIGNEVLHYIWVFGLKVPCFGRIG